MNQDRFVARRQADWQELFGILRQAQQRGPGRLPVERVQRLGRLYRHAASDLAYARTYFPNAAAVTFLNQLVTETHTLIYAEEPQRLLAFWRFLSREAPQVVRAAWRPMLLAFLITVLGAVVAFFAVLADANLADALLPEEIRNFVAVPRSGEIFPVSQRSLIGTYIMINNIRVGVLAYGLGITLGLGTAIVLFYNGVIVGGLAAHFFQAGLSYSFWALILPHGVLELMAIFLCGAAGFAMGWPLVAPGDLSRREAVSRGAARGVRLVAVAIPFFIIAAMIEGWVTPMSNLSEGGKYLVALITGLIGLAYWLFSGRQPVRVAPVP